MTSTFLKVYIVLSVLIAGMDAYLAVMSIRKHRQAGLFLGLACLSAAVVDLSYLASILVDSYLFMSVMSSVYFINIDFMLLCLLTFTVHFTRGGVSRRGRVLIHAASVYAMFETLVFAVNPLTEIAIGYVPRNTVIARYAYEMHPLYICHLVFSYLMVVGVLYLLASKMWQVPREYRAQYGYVMLGIAIIVGVNAVFLYLPGEQIYNLLDYSICGYSLTAYLLYWSCFNYSTHGMLNRLKMSIFDNLGQGIVLFDYDDELILHNQRADQLLGEGQLASCRTLPEFLTRFDIPAEMRLTGESCSLQYFRRTGDGERQLRCDIRELRNRKGQRLGLLFAFSDALLETDLLTGFENWDSFQLFLKDARGAFQPPVGVAVLDINGLSLINSSRGRQQGDQRIRELAQAMRGCFPKRAYFVRGPEAALIALCSHGSEAEMLRFCQQVAACYETPMQYAVGATGENDADVDGLIRTALRTLTTKKLLDRESIHSEMISSLIRALEECDSDTEHHVRRTRELGAALGERIRLTDKEQSELALLCLLHDIGKIGIPLEILNKPGKLSDEEWVILRSHAEKGYEIAQSNTELKGIAEEIRHHHERWDGTGYPDGLSRESIPLLSRVICVVDSYDAMVSNRAYRPAMSPEKAMEELRRCAGSQFDPFLVSEFLQLLRERPDLVARAEKPAGDIPSAARGDLPHDAPAENPLAVHPVPYSRYIIDEHWRVLSADEQFEALTGYSPEDIANGLVDQSTLIPEEDLTEYLCGTNARLAKSPRVFQEHRLRRKDGRDLYVFCYGRAYFDSAARAVRSEILVADVSRTYAVQMLMEAEQSKAQARLRQWEITYRRDSLTGLLTHAAFRSDVEQQLLEGRCRVVMLMMDIDHFKEYNDRRGHHEGDELLVLLAQTLLGSIREEDRVCRMGGDEFAAALFVSRDLSDERIRERAQQFFDKVSMTLSATGCGVSISMGMMIARPDMTFNSLYEAADQALYRAKQEGRSRLVWGE